MSDPAGAGAGGGAGPRGSRKARGSESVTVFLRIRPTPSAAGSLFDVAADNQSVTLHPPIGNGTAHETRINAASPATALKLTFGLGQTPSKIP